MCYFAKRNPDFSSQITRIKQVIPNADFSVIGSRRPCRISSPWSKPHRNRIPASAPRPRYLKLKQLIYSNTHLHIIYKHLPGVIPGRTGTRVPRAVCILCLHLVLSTGWVSARRCCWFEDFDAVRAFITIYWIIYYTDRCYDLRHIGSVPTWCLQIMY